MALAETLVEIERATESGTLPALEPGDHLDRREFERRYDAMPGLNKAELIGGIVYMSSPVRLRKHGRPHIHISTWLGVYEASTPGVLAGDNVSIRLDEDNMPQPDAMMLIEPDRGGQATVTADDYIERGPELVVEVASSTASMDLNTKLQVYRRHQVREYVVWRVLDRAIDWFALRDEEYARLAVGADGIFKSQAFPGLWLDPRAMVGANLTGVLEVLARGIADPGHRDFVDRLKPKVG